MDRGMPLPRVLLVEDDAAVRKLVALALEDLALDLVPCGDVPEALAALSQAPAQLVITDLMLPGVSGMALLERLHGDTGLCAGARRVAFSAGLDAATRQRLLALDVWRLLDKPVAVQTLCDCVAEALGLPAPAWASAATDADLIDRNFAGDAGLFHAFRDIARQQFSVDVEAGERALLARDASALRRLAHSLKSVLDSLGESAAAEQARTLEAAAAQIDWRRLQNEWPPLAAMLQALAGPPK